MDREYSFEKVHLSYDGGNLNVDSSFVTIKRCPVQLKSLYSYSKENADAKFNEVTTLFRDCSRELETALAIIRNLQQQVNPLKQTNVGLRKKTQVYERKLKQSKLETENLLQIERQNWEEEKAALHAQINDLLRKNEDCNETINEQQRNIQENFEQSQKVHSLEAENKMLQDKIGELHEENEQMNLKLENSEHKETHMEEQIQDLLFQLNLKDLRIVLKKTANVGEPEDSELNSFENSADLERGGESSGLEGERGSEEGEQHGRAPGRRPKCLCGISFGSEGHLIAHLSDFGVEEPIPSTSRVALFNFQKRTGLEQSRRKKVSKKGGDESKDVGNKGKLNAFEEMDESFMMGSFYQKSMIKGKRKTAVENSELRIIRRSARLASKHK